MAKGTIIFRADGGANLGMGHFIRSLALAEMLNQSFNCIFATRNPSEYQLKEISSVCHKYINLSNDDEHYLQFLNILTGNEIVVLDNYFFSTDYQRAIRAKGCKLVCIDDLNEIHFVADMIINHSIGADPSVYSKETYTKVLTGLDFALLRQPYFQDDASFDEKKYGAVIIMGGTDPLDLSTKTLHILNQIKFPKPIAVVGKVNSTFHGNNSINVSHFEHLSSFQILSLMRTSEFGLLPASTVSIEACAARLPFICGYFVENQKKNYDNIKEQELAICIGDWTKIGSLSLCAAIKKITTPDTIRRVTKNQVKMLDRKSNIRLVNAFLEL
jgi:UDP-2,4-diacetamido-2,4,6-trideoxy-beta-L-altropyranose hydrolase